MGRLRLATLWLGGCSGCHMSFLDMDEFLIDLAGKVDVVYSPLVDAKGYPENVDVALVEGAVCNEEHVETARLVRARTRTVVSFGDCAVTGNVTAIRNSGGAEPVLRRVYLENGDRGARVPEGRGIVPRLLDVVTPLHALIHVDFYLPGCPPPAPRIRAVLEALVEGRPPHLEGAEIRFG
jgi:NAD-reducing hydrogenase small subunit